MKALRRIISAVIIATVVSCATVTASADENVGKIGDDAKQYLASTVSYDSRVNAVLANAWDSYATSVSVIDYKIKSSDFADVYINVSDLYPEYFYLDIANTTYYINSAGYITKIDIAYLYSPVTCNKQRAQLETAVSNVLSKMRGIKGEEDKIVFLHDYITAHNAYDFNGVLGDANAVDDYSFTAYGCLVNNISVCQGMSDAFLLLCKRLGISAAMATSDDMVHAWNFVKTGDSFYHLDITWDDDCSDSGLSFDGYSFLDLKGFAAHNYFMKSDLQMLSLEHYSWEQTHYAKDELTYRDYYWNDVYSQIFFIKGYQYYIKDSKLIKRNPTTKEEKVLYTIDNSTFSVGENQYAWYSRSSVLAYNYKDNFLIINLADGAYAYNLNSGELTKVFEFNEDGYIGGMILDDMTMLYDVVSVKDNKFYQTSDNSAQITFPSYSADYGDVDGEEGVGISDILYMKKFFLDSKVDINEFSADVNEDNSVDAKDLLMMIKKQAGYSVNFGG